MLHETAEQKNWIMRIACVLLVLALISTRLVCGLYARFSSSDSTGDGARVAAFAFVASDKESSQYLDLSGIQKPGDKRTYTFTVSNRNGSAVSEVEEKYSFTVRLNGSMPLKCTIAKGDSGEGTADSGENSGNGAAGNPDENSREAENVVLTAGIPENASGFPVVVNKEDVGTLPASAGQIHTYTLTAEWPKDANDAKYASRSAAAEVLLTVTAEQVD